MTTTGTDTGTARETAATAADQAKHVGQVGAEEVQNVAAEAKNQVRTLVDETRTQLNDQSTQQRDRLVGTLQTLSLDLEDMASRAQSSGLATELARQAAERARDLSSRLDGREPSELLDEVRSFARRRPGTFLLGAVVAGVVAGRLARGAKASTGTAAPDETRLPRVATSDPGNGWDARVSTTAPTADTEVPRVAPAYSAPYAADHPTGGDAVQLGEASRIAGVGQEGSDLGRGQAGSPHGTTP